MVPIGLDCDADDSKASGIDDVDGEEDGNRNSNNNPEG